MPAKAGIQIALYVPIWRVDARLRGHEASVADAQGLIAHCIERKLKSLKIKPL